MMNTGQFLYHSVLIKLFCKHRKKGYADSNRDLVNFPPCMCMCMVNKHWDGDGNSDIP